MDAKITGIVSYITIIGWIVAFVIGDKENAKFHINQALVLNVAGIVAAILSKIPIIGIIGSILGVLILILAVIGIYSAAIGKEIRIPVVSDIKIF